MKTLDLDSPNLPFLLGGEGNLSVSVPQIDPLDRLPAGVSQILNVKFGGKGESKFEFGKSAGLKIGVKAGATFAIHANWKEDGSLALLLDSGLSASTNLHAKQQYGFLKATATLEAGVDTRFQYLAPANPSATVAQMLGDFFRGVRLPSQLTAPPAPGEEISFTFSGRLAFGASFGPGYELAGTPLFQIGAYKSPERYKLAASAAIGFKADVAGSFAVTVAADPAAGSEWARITVGKEQSAGFGIAADVKVSANGPLHGLPGTPNEFLGAVLGVNVRNWIKLLSKANPGPGFDEFFKTLDGLSKKFIAEWTGNAGKAAKVTASASKISDTSVALYEAYADNPGELEKQLTAIDSLRSLEGGVDSGLWTILNQLTDGDPLALVGPDATKSMTRIRESVQNLRSLIRDDEHEEMRAVVRVAKAGFSVTKLFRELRKYDSPNELKAAAGTAAAYFAERLLGAALSEIGVKEAFARLQKVYAELDKFEDTFFGKLLDTAKQSIGFNIHAGYNRASSSSALIDVSLNLSTPAGLELLDQACRGDFSALLSAAEDADLVRINSGVLTRSLKKTTSFTITVQGLTGSFQRAALDTVIVNTTQRIVPAGNGGITVYTQLDFQKEKERKRAKERTYTNFLVQLMGESANPKWDPSARQYAIDALKGMAASYQLLLEDDRTSAAELERIAAFAKEFGLDAHGVTGEKLAEILPAAGSGAERHFGSVTANYNVRYTESTIDNLLRVKFDSQAETLVRQTMRRLVRDSYASSRHVTLPATGRTYANEATYSMWAKQGAAFVQQPLSEGGRALTREQIRLVDSLYRIEEGMIEGLRLLYGEVRKGSGLNPAKLSKAAEKLGDALKNFDGFDEDDNSVFAIFDRLVAAAGFGGGPEVRVSSLELRSSVMVDGQQQRVTKVFLNA